MKTLLAMLMLGVVVPVSASAASSRETAVLAGGCFWGVEGVFEHVRGVSGVVSGYAGGNAADASYDRVSSERTSHAEAVRITFDPRVISYRQLLHIYATVAHDPTQLNRQGPDTGTSYRSAIFPQNAAQAAVARDYLKRLSASGTWKRPIVTRIEQGGFYPAEAAHQDFMRLHPTHPYIVINDRPKLDALRKRFPVFWRA